MAKVVETEVLRDEENYYEGYMVAIDAPDYETAKRMAYVNYDCFKRTELPTILAEERERRIEETRRNWVGYSDEYLDDEDYEAEEDDDFMW